MPAITREDGERFVIPSYRETLSAKKSGLLKHEVELLSQTYGEYITLQKKNATQYEVAFSSEPGYLLGDSIWNSLKRPSDMIYCEALPNGLDAILVIVKAGSVYLDGSFPLDSIEDELVVFKTQRNHFDIYIYGDVPISKDPEVGKINFDATSVESFTELTTPIFKTLVPTRNFQLQLVENVLASQGIGAFNIKPYLIAIVTAIVIWIGWMMFFQESDSTTSIASMSIINPYEQFNTSLASPKPSKQLATVYKQLVLLHSIPGWRPTKGTYSANNNTATLRFAMISSGALAEALLKWASRHDAKVEILSNGFFVTLTSKEINRPIPKTVNNSQQVIATLIDNISYVMTGNVIQMGAIVDKSKYKETQLTITFAKVAPSMLILLGKQLENLPLVLDKVDLTIDKGDVSGSISLRALGN